MSKDGMPFVDKMRPFLKDKKIEPRVYTQKELDIKQFVWEAMERYLRYTCLEGNAQDVRNFCTMLWIDVATPPERNNMFGGSMISHLTEQELKKLLTK